MKKQDSTTESEPSSCQSIFSCIDNGLQYVVISLLWFYGLYAILWYTGVISVITSFSQSFRYIQGETPLTRTETVVMLIGGYVLSLQPLQSVMQLFKPKSLHKIMVIHNLFLMMASAFLAICIAYFIMKDIKSFGFYHSICSSQSHDNAYLHLFYYINYLLKYYEFIDTYIIIFKKRPLIFLHWYHHAITVLLTYIQQNDYTPVQWVPILMNLIVHVVMYFYYFLSALHVKVWWKKYLTLFQIIQFVVDLSICCYCLYQLLMDPNSCYGTTLAAYSGIGIIGSYFFLFLNFYFRNYKEKRKIE